MNVFINSIVKNAYIKGIKDYYQMKAELELLRTLAEAEEDVVNGRVAPMQETFDGERSMHNKKAEQYTILCRIIVAFVRNNSKSINSKQQCCKTRIVNNIKGYICLLYN